MIPDTEVLFTGLTVPGAWVSINKVDVERSTVRTMEFVFQPNGSNHLLTVESACYSVGRRNATRVGEGRKR